MKILISEAAIADLGKMDNSIYERFKKHIQSIKGPLRHLRHGLPFEVDEIGQGRIILKQEGDTITVYRCFARHKDYEDWYRSLS